MKICELQVSFASWRNWVGGWNFYHIFQSDSVACGLSKKQKLVHPSMRSLNPRIFCSPSWGGGGLWRFGFFANYFPNNAHTEKMSKQKLRSIKKRTFLVLWLFSSGDRGEKLGCAEENHFRNFRLKQIIFKNLLNLSLLEFFWKDFPPL